MLAMFVMVIIVAVMALNFYVRISSAKDIYDESLLLVGSEYNQDNINQDSLAADSLKQNETSDFFEDCDGILILGASIRHGEPSPMLADRLERGIEIYETLKGSRADGSNVPIIMSGDGANDYYNEVSVMRKYAIDRGVPEEDIICDSFGVSTYDSFYRAKNVLNMDKLIIVSQEYHLYRAVYIAEHTGINSKGLCAEKISYKGDAYREIREILARGKDFFKCIFKMTSEYVSLNGLY